MYPPLPSSEGASGGSLEAGVVGGPRRVREEPWRGELEVHALREWGEAFPWLTQGVTGRGRDGAPFDLSLFGRGATAEVLPRWDALARAAGLRRVVHGRQVHGAAVRLHEAGPPGLHVAPPCDGHVTLAPGVLLTVGLADCAAVSLVDPSRRAVGLLHGGWRGVAAGILERGLEVLAVRAGTRPADLHVHLGPAICGDCYEVGPEVHEALGLPVPERPAPVDLRAVLAARALAAGVPGERITVSGHCTRCGDSPFFSHRAGCRERHVAFLGVRE